MSISRERQHEPAAGKRTLSEPSRDLRTPQPGKRTLSQAIGGEQPVQAMQSGSPAARPAGPASSEAASTAAGAAPRATLASLFGGPAARSGYGAVGDAGAGHEAAAGRGATVKIAMPGPDPVGPPITTGGAALPVAVRSKMESSFGADFSSVQVHAGSSQATALGAEAFACGDALHFAPGRYQPSSPDGQALIGHELSHVVQQRAGRVAASVQARGVAINDDPALEREADEQGARAARGEPALAATSGGAKGAPVVQGVWVCTPQGGMIELPGDIPPPWLGTHFYFYQGVFYPAQHYPQLYGIGYPWTYPFQSQQPPSNVNTTQSQPLPPPNMGPTMDGSLDGQHDEVDPFEMEVMTEDKPKQQRPKPPDPDVIEAEATINKTPGMNSLAKKPLLRFLQGAKDLGGLQTVLDARQAFLDKQIIGFESWFRRILKTTDVGNYLFELREALRLAREDLRPVQIDNDSLETRTGVASIDLMVRKNTTTEITRSVEVMGYAPELDSYGAFFEGVRQGADHLISKLQRGASARGNLEATVAMAFRPEQNYGDWPARACADLVNLNGNALIHQLNLVNRSDGQRRFCLVRDGKRWDVH